MNISEFISPALVQIKVTTGALERQRDDPRKGATPAKLLLWVLLQP